MWCFRRDATRPNTTRSYATGERVVDGSNHRETHNERVRSIDRVIEREREIQGAVDWNDGRPTKRDEASIGRVLAGDTTPVRGRKQPGAFETFRSEAPARTTRDDETDPIDPVRLHSTSNPNAAIRKSQRHASRNTACIVLHRCTVESGFSPHIFPLLKKNAFYKITALNHHCCCCCSCVVIRTLANWTRTCFGGFPRSSSLSRRRTS